MNNQEFSAVNVLADSSTETLMNPIMDFVFKQLFGQDERKRNLIALLNATLRPDNPIIDVTYKNPELDKEYDMDKMSRLDVLAETNRHELINVEIQVQDRKNTEPRFLYYWSKLYGNQMTVSQKYNELKKAISIVILNYKFDDHDRYHSVLEIKNEFNEPVMPQFKMHVIELPKIAEKLDVSDPLSFWAVFMNNPKNEELLALAKTNQPEILNAKGDLMKMSNDPNIRRLYELREKELFDEYDRIATARDEGIEEGIEKGIEQGIEKGIEKNKLDMAQKMLATLPNEVISEFTGLTTEVIQKLREE